MNIFSMIYPNLWKEIASQEHTAYLREYNRIRQMKVNN